MVQEKYLMDNYEYQNITKILFGKDQQKKVGKEIKPYSNKVLFIYGGGSIKRNGLYDDVCDSLRENSIDWIEFSGVRSQPTVQQVYEGINLCRSEDVRFVLGVGGGSAVDFAKAVALGVPYDGDVWDFFSGQTKAKTALPVGCILTTPATGTESSRNAVISNTETKQKMGLTESWIRPAFAILNPEYCLTLPMKNVAYATADMMSHIMERYFTNTIGTDVIDGFCESLLKTIMRNAVYYKSHPQDYHAMGELVMAGNLGHNGLLSIGRETDWAGHGLEEVISGCYPKIAHGAGLPVVTLAWMKYVYQKHLPIFVQFATNVMGVYIAPREPEKVAYQGIMELENFYKRMGLFTTMEEIGINPSEYAKLADQCIREHGGSLGKLEVLYEQDIVNIYRLA